MQLPTCSHCSPPVCPLEVTRTMFAECKSHFNKLFNLKLSIILQRILEFSNRKWSDEEVPDVAMEVCEPPEITLENCLMSRKYVVHKRVSINFNGFSMCCDMASSPQNNYSLKLISVAGKALYDPAKYSSVVQCEAEVMGSWRHWKILESKEYWVSILVWSSGWC